ncbi:MAG TPA: hypothetical protein VFD58_29910 [Blastocatellia bacterium]|nr:hypothetical protein [Blastocatellia bacterium]
MKRMITIAVVLGGLFLMGHFGVTSASKYSLNKIAATNSLEVSAPQGLFEQELIRADIDRANLGLAMSPVPV